MKKTIIIIYSIIYSVVIAGAGIFALAFQDQLDVGVGSLLPAAVLAYALTVGLLLRFRVLCLRGNRLRIRTFVDFDFKYSKGKDGKGSIDMVDPDSKRVRISDRNSQILSSVLLISGAVAVPFIFLFSFNVKSVATMILCVVVGGATCLIEVISMVIEIKRAGSEQNGKDSREMQELEEQKKREEMGYWK